MAAMNGQKNSAVCWFRRPTTQQRWHRLENTKVKFDKRGFVQTDSSQRTDDPHIFGHRRYSRRADAGSQGVASRKSRSRSIARRANRIRTARHSRRRFHRSRNCLGRIDEEQAKRDGRQVEVIRYPWAASGRAVFPWSHEGLTKFLIDPESERLLGVGIVGAGAGELIAEGVLAIEMGCSARDVAESIHPHPTLSETVAFANEAFLRHCDRNLPPRAVEK